METETTSGGVIVFVLRFPSFLSCGISTMALAFVDISCCVDVNTEPMLHTLFFFHASAMHTYARANKAWSLRSTNSSSS